MDFFTWMVGVVATVCLGALWWTAVEQGYPAYVQGAFLLLILVQVFSLGREYGASRRSGPHKHRR